MKPCRATIRILAGLLPVALECLVSATATAQSPPQYTLRVNGEPVAATRAPARVAGEWFVPLAPVARALGVELRIDPTAQSLQIVRGDGVAASYDAASGRILQGSIMAAQVASFRQVQLNVGLENILFPLDGVIALFGVTVREEPDQQVLDIEAIPSSGGGGSGSGPYFHLASLEDRYSLATNGQAWQQSLNFRGQALMGGNRLTGNVDLSQAAGGVVPALRQGFVRLETTRRAITLGDQGTYIGLDAMSNSVRGLGYEWRWGKFVADGYGGRAASSISSALGSSGVAAYDATLAGFGLRRRSKTSDLSLAGNVFRGTERRGATLAAGFSGAYARNEFRVQGLAGYFSGSSLRPVLQAATAGAVQQAPNAAAESQGVAAAPPGSVVQVEEPSGQVRGPAYGFSVVDTFTPFRNNKLSLTGLWERYSRNFLVVREESRFSAVARKSLSANLRPSRYVSFLGSMHGSTALLGEPNPERGYTFGVNASTPGNTPIQPGYFRSVQTNGGSLGRFVLSQYSLQLPHLNRYAASAAYSEIRFAGVLTRVVTETFTADLKRYGRLGFHDQLQLASNHNYGLDWSRQFGMKGAYFTGGLERQTGLQQRPGLAPVAALRLPLGRGQSLTVSYFRVRGSSLFRFEIGGPMLRRRELVVLNNTQTAIAVQASLGGQVYFDADLNGQFTSGVDRPIAQLQVWLDEELVTTTDSGGYFRFDGLATGTHRLRVDMASLPANLIIANTDLKAAVLPYRPNRQDFQAIPAGRIQGRVTIARVDEAGRELIAPLPDARIFATGNRDSFSEGDGTFFLGDLPPGTFQLRVDPATVPAGFVAAPALRTVELKPGQSVRDIDFRLSRPVIVKPAPPAVSRVIVH